MIEGIPAGVRTALHLCRGNHKSKWIYNGPMDAYAERMFNELPYDVFLMEWEDTAREGDYSALRHVPDGPIVAMGDHEQQEAARRDGRRAGARDRGGERSTSTSTGSRSRRSAASPRPTSAMRSPRTSSGASSRRLSRPPSGSGREPSGAEGPTP